MIIGAVFIDLLLARAWRCSADRNAGNLLKGMWGSLIELVSLTIMTLQVELVLCPLPKALKAEQ